jgi:hypothetical protein
MTSKQQVFMLFLFFLMHVIPGRSQDLFPWPVEPFYENHYVTGTFCEYRSTTTPGHFHNGTDIPKPDYSPVYPVRDGIVTTIYPTGTDRYVRVQDKAYVHITPNPALSVGDSVYASVTVLGNILAGQGHVHLTNGYAGSEVNSMVDHNSLAYLVDTWAPEITYVRFYQNNTTNEFPALNVNGLVDIVVKVEEHNAPPGSSTSVLNNGTYKLGYRILSSDTATVVYEPPIGGVRYQFDVKPNNSYINYVYFAPLSSTSSHVYQVTNSIGIDNYWDTRDLTEGEYVVMVFTEDTRQNTDTAYVRVRVVPTDTTPPAQPVFRYLKGDNTGIHLAWYPNSDQDLQGYRLYFSFDNSQWTLFKDETVLTSAMTDTLLRQVINNDVYFRLTAVDNAPLPNESISSDIYGSCNGAAFTHRVLLVDGFDRTDGAWPVPYHIFGFTWGRALKNNQVAFDTAPNEAVTDSLVALNDYEAVFWILGDESVVDETFSAAEQQLVTQYLENGGNLFVSGCNIATDLDPDTNPAATAGDSLFLSGYLKADYATHEPDLHNVNGLGGSIFDGFSASVGQSPYSLDSMDIILPLAGAAAGLEYAAGQTAALFYEGTFGNGSIAGHLVYCAFPFETIFNAQVRDDFFSRILNFFFETLSIQSDNTAGIPENFRILPNYPNPFNLSTAIRFQLPTASRVELVIYDMLGRKVKQLVKGEIHSGSYRVVWNGRNQQNQAVSSGVYIARFLADALNSQGSFQKSWKLLLMK